MTKGCAVFVIAALAGLTLLAQMGSNIRPNTSGPDFDQNGLANDAKSALRMKLQNPKTRELHLLTDERVVCGQVAHDETDMFVPFAYNHSLGLSVAKVWGKDQPEELNRRYGCKFLPLAYTDEWTKPFWGGQPDGDIYVP